MSDIEDDHQARLMIGLESSDTSRVSAQQISVFVQAYEYIDTCLESPESSRGKMDQNDTLAAVFLCVCVSRQGQGFFVEMMPGSWKQKLRISRLRAVVDLPTDVGFY